MKNLLIINGHPDKESFNFALSKSFEVGIDKSLWNVQRIDLIDLDFTLILEKGYRKRTELEPDLLRSIEMIQFADHIVWFFPVWWYGVPALLKGFIDRTFLPGIAFAYNDDSSFPVKLYKGKSARLVVTADTPRWYDWLFMGSPVLKQFKKGTLQFCGISPIRVNYIAPLRGSSEKFREKWLQKINKIARQTT